MDESSSGPGADRRPPVPDPPPPPPPPSESGPEGAWPAPAPTQRATSSGFPWKVIAAVAVAGAVMLGGVVALGVVVVNGFGDGFTAHIDRANQYLDALRTDPAAAAAMRCPGAEDLNVGALASTTGQDLTSFEVDNGDGEVHGSVQFPDGESRAVTVLTDGPALPTGDRPAAEVCIVTTSLG